MKASERLKELKKNIKSLDPNLFSFLKEEIPNRIRSRTRLGKGVSEAGELQGLKALSKSYQERRKRMKLSQFTRPKKSNLTLTGEMLDSMAGKQEGFKFTFSFKTAFADKKAGWAKKAGRPFFALAKTEIVGVERKVAGILRKVIRSIFK